MAVTTATEIKGNEVNNRYDDSDDNDNDNDSV